MSVVQGVKRQRSPSPPVPAVTTAVPADDDEADYWAEGADAEEFKALYAKEQKEAEEAGESLAEGDGTAAVYDTESDDAVRKFIIKGWQTVLDVFKPDEVSTPLLFACFAIFPVADSFLTDQRHSRLFSQRDPPVCCYPLHVRQNTYCE